MLFLVGSPPFHTRLVQRGCNQQNLGQPDNDQAYVSNAAKSTSHEFNNVYEQVCFYLSYHLQ